MCARFFICSKYIVVQLFILVLWTYTYYVHVPTRNIHEKKYEETKLFSAAFHLVPHIWQLMQPLRCIPLNYFLKSLIVFYSRFYLSPLSVFNIIWNCQSWVEMKTKWAEWRKENRAKKLAMMKRISPKETIDQ